MTRSKKLLSALAGAIFLALAQLPVHGAASENPTLPRSASDGGAESPGERLYKQNCRFCHQTDALGVAGFAPSLTNEELLATASDKFLLTTIRDGRMGTGMPPFAHLGRKGIKSIVAYLRAHTDKPTRAAEVDAQPEARGDAGRGKVQFDLICSTCHGVNGDGYSAGGTGTAIGKAGFLQKASDGFIRETIRHGRSNTRMRGLQGPEGLANLSDQEIDDIIIYMRSLPNQ